MCVDILLHAHSRDVSNDVTQSTPGRHIEIKPNVLPPWTGCVMWCVQWVRKKSYNNLSRNVLEPITLRNSNHTVFRTIMKD